LNGALCNNIAPGKFVTLFYGVLDSRNKRFIFENAGHCQPIVIRKDGRIDVPSSSSGVLGVFPEWTYEDREISLDVGDCLLLLTDGLIEASGEDEEEFGIERMAQVLQRHRHLPAHLIREEILREVTQFCSRAFQDDASLIVVVST
jgi:sigma-B regulation protein RsbU (phosphoserine phosphatase)